MKRYLASQRGVTLIEMMVVIVIIGILSGVIYANYSSRPHQARMTRAGLEIRELQTALELYALDNGTYPSTEQGLEALASKPSSGKVPKYYPESGYMPRIPDDPWDNDYIYIYPGSHEDFDIESYGADGEDGGSGKGEDIESWNLE